MVILRQRMRSKPERADDVSSALAAISLAARATQGVISLDIAGDLLEPGSFVATGVYEDSAAIERQESAPEVHGRWRCFRGGSRRRPTERSTKRRATRRSSELLVVGIVLAASVGDLRLRRSTLEPGTAAPHACSSSTTTSGRAPRGIRGPPAPIAGPAA